jgi:hypothetical protein
MDIIAMLNTTLFGVLPAWVLLLLVIVGAAGVGIYVVRRR